MIKPAKFAHAVYQTRRFDAMIAWYEAVFGARVVHRDPALAFLTYDDEHHRFAFANLEVMGAPDGNRMEFQVDALADYMESEAFHANPVGVAYDPEALLVRWEQGASEAELLKMPAGAMAPIPAEHGMG